MAKITLGALTSRIAALTAAIDMAVQSLHVHQTPKTGPLSAEQPEPAASDTPTPERPSDRRTAFDPASLNDKEIAAVLDWVQDLIEDDPTAARRIARHVTTELLAIGIIDRHFNRDVGVRRAIDHVRAACGGCVCQAAHAEECTCSPSELGRIERRLTA